MALYGLALTRFVLFYLISFVDIPQVDIAISLPVVNTQDLGAIREFTLSVSG